jgi:hypothetical protein
MQLGTAGCLWWSCAELLWQAFLHTLCCLVHFLCFQHVEWHLLIPGHTHEDIDAWFSIISR